MSKKEEIINSFNSLQEKQQYDFYEYIMYCVNHLNKDEPAREVYNAYRRLVGQ